MCNGHIFDKISSITKSGCALWVWVLLCLWKDDQHLPLYVGDQGAPECRKASPVQSLPEIASVREEMDLYLCCD